jgi:hypothetical protein
MRRTTPWSSDLRHVVLATALFAVPSIRGDHRAAGSNWYLQNKAKQVCAKDAFDAINNEVAFLF